MYLHIYYSPEKRVEKENAFNLLLTNLQSEFINEERQAERQKLYGKYFEISNPVRGLKILPKEDAIADAVKDFGFFALISNDIKDPISALQIYRNKDLAEKAFGNLKERLNLRKLSVSSEQSLDGKLFVEFIALIILSYIKKRMQDNNLFKDYTMQELLDELDIIECFELSGKRIRIGEITKKQIQLYEKLGIEPPTSLQ
jgi:transposase